MSSGTGLVDECSDWWLGDEDNEEEEEMDLFVPGVPALHCNGASWTHQTHSSRLLNDQGHERVLMKSGREKRNSSFICVHAT